MPMTDEAKQQLKVSAQALTARDDSGRFPKGVSGNPAGRPKGARNKTTVLREMLDEVALGEVAREYIDVIHAMIRRAKAGDVAAAKFIQQIAAIASEEEGSSGGKSIHVTIENFTQQVYNEAETDGG